MNLRNIQHVRQRFPAAKVSVEAEKPGRPGLQEMAAEADVVFFSKSWAQVCRLPRLRHLNIYYQRLSLTAICFWK